LRRAHSTIRSVTAVLVGIVAVAAADLAATGLVDVRTEVLAPDSITVGERFGVRHVFSYADSLVMAVPGEIAPGTCRIMSLVWSENESDGRIAKTAAYTMITLDLEEARLPALAVEFYTPSGDTLIAFADEVVVPVRHLANEGTAARPLKAQWTAPRRYWPWIVAATALIAAAVLLWWWLRRRSRREETAPQKARLPADYVALTELTRVEKMNLLASGEFKLYYSLVTEAVRRYLQDRFGVDAMDRTTTELLDELSDLGRRVEKLDSLLCEADLVKFAKHVPDVEAGTVAMSSAREIVVKTTPRRIVPKQEETAAAEGAA
jgi:hypothetical protein